MYNIERTLRIKGNRARLVFLSCMHVGHIYHDYKLFKKWMEDVLMQEDTFVFMLGDTIDNGTKHSPGASIFEQKGSPKEQVQEAFDILTKLVSLKRVIVWHESNHSFRTRKESGFFTAEEWLIERFNDRLDAGIAWGGWQAITTLKLESEDPEFQRKTPLKYVVHSMHGTGGGVSIGGPLTALSKQSECQEGADIVARGHHHRTIITPDARYGPVRGGRKTKPHKFLMAATACFLDYHDSYGEMKNYRPNVGGCAVIDIFAKERKLHGHIVVED